MNPITETHYTVNDVGNANCIFIDRFKHRNYESTLINVCNIHFFINFHEGDLKRRNLLIDFGYDHTKHLDHNLKEQVRNADEFLLSHYHLDHYKGLEKMEDKSLYIEKIYYPHIPQMHNRYTLLKACYFICIVDGNDLINLLKQKNKTTDFIKKTYL